MSDKPGSTEAGSIRWLRRHDPDFRKKVSEQRAASIAAAAIEQEEAEKSARRAERQRLADEQRAARGNGSMQSGRDRYDARHKKPATTTFED